MASTEDGSPLASVEGRDRELAPLQPVSAASIAADGPPPGQSAPRGRVSPSPALLTTSPPSPLPTSPPSLLTGLPFAPPSLPTSATSLLPSHPSPAYTLLSSPSTRPSLGPPLTFSSPPSSLPPSSHPSPLHGLSSVPMAMTGRTAGNLHADQIRLLNSLLLQQDHQRKLAPSAAPPATSSVRVVGGERGRVVMKSVVKPHDDQEEISKMAKEGVQQALSEEVFSSYTNTHPVFAHAKPHPAAIVEAASLSDVPLPPATYDLSSSIPREAIDSGKLSRLQLEGILYACQRHLTILPNGHRAGFFIGDGAGVGKGRQIAGIILDSYARGRCKHIWFSVSHDLKMDAERDLRDIGTFIKIIDGCQQLDRETKVLGLPADFKEGVVFSTYATLVSTVQRGGQSLSRLQQLVGWCGGPAFDGCLIFDECHKAKNFIPGKESRSTKVSLAVTTVQRMLPRARVVYCSATGVSNVKHLAYMDRLGLWGEGSGHLSFEDFLSGITRRGLGAAEMIAMEMKSAGMYVSRGLSFQDAEFTSLEVSLTPEQVKIYDSASHVWNELRRSLTIALSRVGSPSQRIWAPFWGAHQRFFKQLCMSMKVPAIVAEVRAALAGGSCAVVGLQTTGESSLESELQRNDGELTDFISLTQEILLHFITDHFPTTLQQKQPEGVAISDLWCVTAKDMISEYVSKMELPHSPLDDIIDQLGGPECVAEMTGRRGRLVRVRGGRREGVRVRYELRDTGGSALESLNNRERAAFMEGDKLIAIISDAASTGISLHSDLSARNGRRRIHITMELPWSADKAVQQLGRTHRAHQASGPLYKLVTTNLGGERRFASAVAKRLQTLGALTKGDRRAATGVEFGSSDVDNQYGRSALRHMHDSITKRQLFVGVDLTSVCIAGGVKDGGISLDAFFTTLQEGLELMGAGEGEAEVGKFLNRILGLKVHQQNLLFAYFTECLSVVIATAQHEGRFNEGVTDIMAQSIKMVGTTTEVFQDYKLSHVPTIHTHVVVDRGVCWEDAVALAQGSKVAGGCSFYRSRKKQFQRHLYLLGLPKEGAPHLFNIVRPNTGRSLFEEDRADLLHKYVAIATEEAGAGWMEQYQSTKERCIHGASCKSPASCLIGSRLSHLHLLSGGILPLLSLLESTLARHAHLLGLSRAERSLRVVRVRLDDGRRLIGVRYPLPLISEVAGLLKALRQAQQAQRSPELAVLPTSAKDVSVEAETAVDCRALKRALTPPLTLLTFFKPVTGQAGPADSPSPAPPLHIPSTASSLCPPSAGSSSPMKAPLKGPPSPEATWTSPDQAAAHPHPFTAAAGSGRGMSKPHLPPFAAVAGSGRGTSMQSKPRHTQRTLVGSFSRLQPTSHNHPIVVPNGAPGNGEGVRGAIGEVVRGRPKRKCQAEAGVGGASIERALKRRAGRVAVTCPVCQEELPTTSNLDLNAHLDGCLGGAPARQPPGQD